MKAFVTGSTGLLGSNLVRELVAAGFAVKALARSVDKAQRFLNGTEAEIVVGDMVDIPGFADEMAGCDVLFHTAAYFREYTGADDDAERMLQTINVDGTIALLAAAKARGVHNVIYTSSGGVIAMPANGQPADETSPVNASTPNRYFQSKIRAERAVYDWLQHNPDMRVILILPGAIIGPGDNGPTGLGGLMVDVLNGRLPAIPAGSLCLVDVRDVAAGMVRAAARGKSGDRFIIADQIYELATLIPLAASIGGVKPPAITLPYAVTWMYGAVSELVAKVTRKQPLATRVLVHTLNENIPLSSAKAQRELGVTFRPLEESIRDAVDWFRQNGHA